VPLKSGEGLRLVEGYPQRLYSAVCWACVSVWPSSTGTNSWKCSLGVHDDCDQVKPDERKEDNPGVRRGVRQGGDPAQVDEFALRQSVSQSDSYTEYALRA